MAIETRHFDETKELSGFGCGPLDRMQSLHTRKMYELQALQKEVPNLRRILEEKCANWLKQKQEWEEEDRKLVTVYEKLEPAQQLARMKQRCDQFNKLNEERERLGKQEHLINKRANGDEETAYLLRAVPFLNCSHKYRNELELLDAEMKSNPRPEHKGKREEILKAIRDLSNEYINQFFPIINKDRRKKEAKKHKLMNPEGGSSSSADVEYGEEESGNKEDEEMMQSSDDDYLGNDLSNASYEQIRHLCPQRQFTYRRINHFREYLRQIQGKSRANIPASLIEDLKREFIKAKIPPTSCFFVKTSLRFAK